VDEGSDLDSASASDGAELADEEDPPPSKKRTPAAKRKLGPQVGSLSSLKRELADAKAAKKFKLDTEQAVEEQPGEFQARVKALRVIAPGSSHDHVGFSRCKSYSSYLERATGRRGSRSRLWGEELSAPPEPGYVLACHCCGSSTRGTKENRSR
jgi:hypothetical protein